MNASDIRLANAARMGRNEEVKQHLADGADVNAQNDAGRNALHHAAAWDNKEAAELFLAKGADVNAQMVGGQTPLDMAIMSNAFLIADLIRKNGAK
jgi:ankyrin repeat protein